MWQWEKKQTNKKILTLNKSVLNNKKSLWVNNIIICGDDGVNDIKLTMKQFRKPLNY